MSDESIIGGRQLDDFLKTLSAKVEKNIMRSALRQGANAFKDPVKANIPVDEGDLRKSVRVSVKAKGGTVIASLRVGNKRAWYGHMVEFGTQAHRINPRQAAALEIAGAAVRGVDHPGARAQPFMRPAFDSNHRAAIDAVAAQIRARLTAEGINTAVPEVE